MKHFYLILIQIVLVPVLLLRACSKPEDHTPKKSDIRGATVGLPLDDAVAKLGAAGAKCTDKKQEKNLFTSSCEFQDESSVTVVAESKPPFFEVVAIVYNFKFEDEQDKIKEKIINTYGLKSLDDPKMPYDYSTPDDSLNARLYFNPPSNGTLWLYNRQLNENKPRLRSKDPKF